MEIRYWKMEMSSLKADWFSNHYFSISKTNFEFRTTNFYVDITVSV